LQAEALRVSTTYFGKEGRTNFYEFYRQLCRQRNNHLNQSELGIQQTVQQQQQQQQQQLTTTTAVDSGSKHSTGNSSSGTTSDNNIAAALTVAVATTKATAATATATATTASTPPLIRQHSSMILRMNGTDVKLTLPMLNTKQAGTISSSSTNSRSSNNNKTSTTTATTDEHCAHDAAAIATAGVFECPTSRTKFLFGCVSAARAPRAGLIVRRLQTTRVDLSHCGMGDELGVILSQCLLDMPLMRELNLRDNRLTDTALLPIVRAIKRRPDLHALDLSENKFDGAAATELADYFSDPLLTLAKFVLSAADVDDGEAARYYIHTSIYEQMYICMCIYYYHQVQAPIHIVCMYLYKHVQLLVPVHV
jgi:Leucine Rich repeat